MRKLKITVYFLFIALQIVALSVMAQVQKVSVRAPENIRIDGNSSEWQDKLQVYNTVDRIFYTLSNDDHNLYLTVRAPGPFAIEKIINGGITLSVSTSLDKKIREKEKVAVTFPIIYGVNTVDITSSRYVFQQLKKDTVANLKKIDSLNLRINKQFVDAAKEIKVLGIKAIPDSLVSIYNTEGIKAMGGFNKKMAYTYELAIPLKYLRLSTTDRAPFSYNIKLNAPRLVLDAATNQPIVLTSSDPDLMYIQTATDFWGEYTLAVRN